MTDNISSRPRESALEAPGNPAQGNAAAAAQGQFNGRTAEAGAGGVRLRSASFTSDQSNRSSAVLAKSARPNAQSPAHDDTAVIISARGAARMTNNPMGEADMDDTIGTDAPRIVAADELQPTRSPAARPPFNPNGPHRGKSLNYEQALAAIECGASLDGATVSGIFSGTKFPTGASFYGADLSHVTFLSCTFNHADFRNTQLGDRPFWLCSFKKCQFSPGSLTGSRVIGGCETYFYSFGSFESAGLKCSCLELFDLRRPRQAVVSILRAPAYNQSKNSSTLPTMSTRTNFKFKSAKFLADIAKRIA